MARCRLIIRRLSALLLLGAGVGIAPTAASAQTTESIVVAPKSIELHGLLDFRQLLITGKSPDGKTIDLTHTADIRVEGDVATSVGGLVRPLKEGAATVAIRHGGATVRVPVAVRIADDRPVRFRSDVIASLSVGGCNMGACHGSPSGKNGFRLSLRGQEPALDLIQLTRDSTGRRVSIPRPEGSLVFQKATGQVAHDGGLRFGVKSLPASLLREWMRQGCPDDPESAPLKSLDVLPGDRALATKSQQLVVRATFEDGLVRDVTPLTVYTSSDPSVAEVDGFGRVEFKRPGEVAVVSRYLGLLHVVQLSYIESRTGLVWKDPPANNRIDDVVFVKLRAMQLPPSELCTDHEFLRRAMLDLCCRTPTPDEVTAFLADPSADKRDRLIDKLLAEPTYVDFWTLKWLDVLRANRRNLGQQGLTLYRDWLRGHLEKNTRFDEVVREMMMAKGDTNSIGPANFYRVARAPDDVAEITSQLFLGVRLQCAKCHSHPFEKWTQDDYYSQAAFFSRIGRKAVPRAKNDKNEPGEMISIEVKGESTNIRTGAVMPPRFLAGEVAAVKPDDDRRAVFATWLTAPENPFFARAVVNRVWFHLMGRGIVEPVDDFRESNPPSHPELLNELAREFSKDFDLKKTIRFIMRSRTYQLSSRTNDLNRDDVRYFSHAVPRMLTAEQLFEAVSDLTEVRDKLPGLPAGSRISALADLESASVPTKAFLKTFNQPARDLTCECERASEGSLAQALQVLNGKTVQDKLSAPENRIGQRLKDKIADQVILDELYLAAFARLPRDAERAVLLDYLSKASDRRRGWEDVFWAAMTSREFLLRH